jgi:hypothetical protein
MTILKRYKHLPWAPAIAVGLAIAFTFFPEMHGDLYAFRNEVDTLWHPYWTRWVFSLLALPPEPIAFLILSLASIGLLYFSVRVFGGREWMVFTSFAFAWTLIYGQIDSIVVAGLALAWLAVKKERPVILGAGLIVALMKPQLSLPLAIAFWWWSPSRMKSLIIPVIVFGLTLIQWGFWIPEWITQIFRTQNLETTTQDLINLSRNVSWWPWLGPTTLLVWPLIGFLPMSREKRVLAIAAGTAFSMPYFPLPSTVLHLVMPVPWWVWGLVQVPLLGSVVGYWVYYITKALTLSLLVWVLWSPVREVWVQRFHKDVE